MTNEELINLIRLGQDEYIYELFENNINIINSVISKYSFYSEYEDLKQEAFICLYDALRNWNKEKTAFHIYFKSCLHYHFIRYIELSSGGLRMPSYMQQLIKKCNRIESRWQQDHKEPVPEDYKRAMLGISKEQFETVKLACYLYYCDSLDREIITNDSTMKLCDSVADPDATFEDDVIEKVDAEQMKIDIWNEVETLPDMMQRVIVGMFKEGKTFKEIGELEGITTEAVRQWKTKAIRELRKRNRNKRIKSYYNDYIEAYSFRHIGVKEYSRTFTSIPEKIAIFNDR